MAEDTLRIETTEAEREEADCIAYVFAVRDRYVLIGEEWESDDEVFGAYIDIKVPLRIWNEALPWIAERLSPPPQSE